MKLTHKTILITGASSGLGRTLALALAGGDNNLIVTARRKELLDELAVEVERGGSRCLAIAADATNTEACARVVEQGVARFGAIDVAVLNAGGGTPTVMGSPEATASVVLDIMAKNFDTFVNFLCPVIALMKERGGTIAYTGSPAGTFGLPKSGPYSAAKAAGRTLFDTCRIELAHTPIRFVALYPGFTYTDSLDPDEVPVKALIIDKDRAVREMVHAIEHGTDHAMFPKRIAWPVRAASLLPEAVRRQILKRV